MKSDFEWHGDEVIEQLKKLAEKFTGDVNLQDLFTLGFMREHTKYASLDEMITESKLLKDDCAAQELAGVLESQEWNQFVSKNSDFRSWEEMIAAAGESHLKTLLEG
jgi:hypothetical protein